MAASFEVSETDHMVADLAAGSARCEFVRYKFITQVTDEPIGDPIKLDDRFQSEMMDAFEYPHRLFFRFEFRRHDQFAVCDLFVLRRYSPSASVNLTIKLVGVDQRSGLETL